MRYRQLITLAFSILRLSRQRRRSTQVGEVNMRYHLKAKSICMVLAMLVGLAPPMVGSGSADAQVRSSGRDVSRQNIRRSRPAGVQHTQRGNRSHVNRRRGSHAVHRGRPVTRHYRRGGVVVVHPRRHWNRGGAIAAGAAIGFMAGAAATSWAGPPPRAGYCWFYTTSTRTHGFWDWCPR